MKPQGDFFHMGEANNKKHTYISKFNPDVVLVSEAHQDYLCRFNAGDEYKNFNEFITEKEWRDALDNKDGVTYIVYNYIDSEKKEIVAFYTLSVSAIPYTDRWLIPEEERENPEIQYNEVECGISAIVINMFAVSEDYQDLFYIYNDIEKPIAAWILDNLIETIRELTDTIFSAKAILLHAVPEAESFYLQCGFDYVLPNMHTFYTMDSEFQAMYLSLVELKIHYDN